MATRILYALTPNEWQTFFPGNLRKEATSLAGEALVIDPDGTGAQTWPELLTGFRPEIIVAAWKTPPIPWNYRELTGNNLKYVCYLAGSVKKLVTKEQLEGGLWVTDWGDSISRVVAECALMMAIAALRNAGTWQLDMHLNGSWKTAETRSASLFERKVGIHGFGRISRELVQLLQPFNVEIATYSPHAPEAILKEYNVTRARSLDELFSENSVIIELAALTPETAGTVTEELLRKIPAGGAFVNVGRGAVVDEEALAKVASEGDLQVALDVFGKEPLPADSPFRGMRNVFLLPHLAGPTTDRRQDCGKRAIANIRRYLSGEEPEGLVSPSTYANAS